MLGIQQIINILFRKRKEFTGKCELLVPPYLSSINSQPSSDGGELEFRTFRQ